MQIALATYGESHTVKTKFKIEDYRVVKAAAIRTGLLVPEFIRLCVATQMEQDAAATPATPADGTVEAPPRPAVVIDPTGWPPVPAGSVITKSKKAKVA